MMNRWAILMIGFYQKYISPRKGFRCAHGVYFGGDSCSEAVKKIIKRRGVILGFSDIQQQFSRCSLAYSQLNNQKRKRKKKVDDGGYCDVCCNSCDLLRVSPCKRGSPKDDGCDLPCDCHLF